jgi:hypothetical protein
VFINIYRTYSKRFEEYQTFVSPCGEKVEREASMKMQIVSKS